MILMETSSSRRRRSKIKNESGMHTVTCNFPSANKFMPRGIESNQNQSMKMT